MKHNLGAVLGDALALLEGLEHTAASVTDNRRLAAEWAAEHPELTVDLLVDHPPGRDRVEYDLLLGHPEGATVALSFCSDNGNPWTVSYADHWAANYVVTVNGEHVTVQQALKELELEADRDPSLMTRIVDQVLLSQAVQPSDRLVSAEDVQTEVDTFRRARRLIRAEDMAAWLKKMKLTKSEFGGIMAATVMAKRVRDRITSEGEEAYFAANREAFDRISAVVAYVRLSQEADALGAAALRIGLMRAAESPSSRDEYPSIVATFSWSFAGDLPVPLRSAPVGQLVGPFDENGLLGFGQIYAREHATLDDALTRDAVRQGLYCRWLAKQREGAEVQWHWL